LEKLGIKIYNEKSANNIDESIDLLVYFFSIDEDNPEIKKQKKIKKAKELWIRCLFKIFHPNIIGGNKIGKNIKFSNGKVYINRKDFGAM